jgi:acetyl-CoA carboxylase carboxyl transferase subunit alpha
LMMLQYSIYSVISPEGCASILWKSADKAPEAAETLGVTSGKLKALGLVDTIIPEPLGGAHRDADEMALRVKVAIEKKLADFENISIEGLIEHRQKRLLSYGEFEG